MKEIPNQGARRCEPSKLCGMFDENDQRRVENFEGRPTRLRLQDLPAEVACEILTLKCLYQLCANNTKAYSVDRIAQLSGRDLTVELEYADALCRRGDAHRTDGGLYRITDQGAAFLAADERGGAPSLYPDSARGEVRK